VADVIGRFDGFIAQRQGDGALVYFGYPQRAGGRCRAGSPRQPRHRRGPCRRYDRAWTRRCNCPDRRRDRPGGDRRTQRRRNATSRLKLVGDPMVAGGAHAGARRAQHVVAPQSTRRLLGDLFEWGRSGNRDGPPASWSRSRRGACSARAAWQAGSRRCAGAVSARWSDVRRKCSSCWRVTRSPRLDKGRSSSCARSRASENRA